MIQKIKLYGISMGAVAVILLSGAWKNLPEKEPEATEAIVLQEAAGRAADLGTDCRSRGRRSGSGRPDSGGKCNFEPRPFQTFS